MVKILFFTVILVLIALLIIISLEPYWYPAGFFYHYIFEHKLYLHYKAALKQIKEKGSINVLALSQYCSPDIYNEYKNGEFSNTYHILVIENKPVLYLGDRLISSFSIPLIEKLLKK